MMILFVLLVSVIFAADLNADDQFLREILNEGDFSKYSELVSFRKRIYEFSNPMSPSRKSKKLAVWRKAKTPYYHDIYGAKKFETECDYCQVLNFSIFLDLCSIFGVKFASCVSFELDMQLITDHFQYYFENREVEYIRLNNAPKQEVKMEPTVNTDPSVKIEQHVKTESVTLPSTRASDSSTTQSSALLKTTEAATQNVENKLKRRNIFGTVRKSKIPRIEGLLTVSQTSPIMAVRTSHDALIYLCQTLFMRPDGVEDIRYIFQVLKSLCLLICGNDGAQPHFIQSKFFISSTRIEYFSAAKMHALPYRDTLRLLLGTLSLDCSGDSNSVCTKLLYCIFALATRVSDLFPVLGKVSYSIFTSSISIESIEFPYK